MPYKSAKQQAFMHINHPEIAKKWDEEQKKSGKPFPKKGTQAHLAHHSPTKDTPRKAMSGQKGKPSGRESADRSQMAAEEARKAMKPGGPEKQMNDAAMKADMEEGALAQRGMSSKEAAAAWKKTGYKVPTDQSGHHKG